MRYRQIAYTLEFFAGIFKLLGKRIRYVLALKGKDLFILFAFGGLDIAEEVSSRIHDAHIEVFESRRTGDILGDREIELHLSGLADNLGLMVAFVEQRDRTRGHFQHRSPRDGLRELGVERGELRVLLAHLAVLCRDADVLLGQPLVGSVEAVDLAHVVFHHSTHGSQFFLEFGYTAGVSDFGDTQFFEQVLYTLLFTREQILETIVADVQLLVAVKLNSQIFVLLLEFIFFDLHLLHYLSHLAMLIIDEKSQCGKKQHKDSDNSINDGFFHCLLMS